MKKSLISLGIAVSLMGASTAFAFSDTTGHWAQNTIDWGQAQGYVSGYPDGTFKPDQRVSEAEFLSMLVNATKGPVPTVAHPTHWADSVYAFAHSMNYPISDNRDQAISRTHVAELETSTLGLNLSGDEAIKYLLVYGYANGKTGVKTVEGYQGSDSLNRAEAISFIKNLKDKGITGVQARPITPTPTQQPTTPQNPAPTNATIDLTLDQIKQLEMQYATSLSYDDGALTGTPPVLDDRYEWSTVFTLFKKDGKMIVLDWNKKFPEGEKFSLPVNWDEIATGIFRIDMLDKQNPGSRVMTRKIYETNQIDQHVNY